jgi:hypothetical protein
VGAFRKAAVVTRDYGYRARFTDETLGTITCQSESYAAWEVRCLSTNELVLKASSGEPTLTLLIERPASFSVVSKLVPIVAKAMAAAGTIVQMRCRIDQGPWLDMVLANETGILNWNTVEAQDGPHTLTVEAIESNGIRAVSSVTAVVDNAARRVINYWYIQNFGLVTSIVAIVLLSLWIPSKLNRWPRKKLQFFRITGQTSLVPIR